MRGSCGARGASKKMSYESLLEDLLQLQSQTKPQLSLSAPVARETYFAAQALELSSLPSDKLGKTYNRRNLPFARPL